MHFLKLNSELVICSDKVLEILVACVSRNFCWTISDLHRNFTPAHFKLANIQLKVLAEIQKMFPDNVHGTAAMVSTLVKLKCFEGELNQELKTVTGMFKDLLWSHRLSPIFYSDFFNDVASPSDQQLVFLYRLCMEVICEISGNGVLLNTALTTHEDSNFCLLLIKSLSVNPQLLFLTPKLFDQIIIKIAQLLSAENLGVKNFQFIEKELVKRIIQQDFWASCVSFKIFTEFLEQLKSTEALEKYLNFFQKLLLRMWNSSTNPTSMSQLHIIRLVKLLLKLQPELSRSNSVDPRIALLSETSSPESRTRFIKTFQSTGNEPTSENYYETINRLKWLALKGINDSKSSSEVVAKFSELITATVTDCDWNLYSGLILSVMDVMISTTDSQNKVIFMLKFNPALSNGKTKPLEVKLKLLELLFSFIPFARESIGLHGILVRELNKLLGDTDLIVQRAVLRKFRSQLPNPDVSKLKSSLKFDCDAKVELTEDEQLTIILKSKELKIVHKCSNVQHAKFVAETSVGDLKHLQMILKYSKSIQSQQVNENDRNLLHQIIGNFQAVVNGRNPLKRNGSNGFN